MDVTRLCATNRLQTHSSAGVRMSSSIQPTVCLNHWMMQGGQKTAVTVNAGLALAGFEELEGCRQPIYRHQRSRQPSAI